MTINRPGLNIIMAFHNHTATNMSELFIDCLKGGEVKVNIIS